MERTRNSVPFDDHIRWKNDGGGVLCLLDGRRIGPGETFIASPNEISPSFRDVIKPLEPFKTGKKVEVTVVKPVFILKKRDNSNWYDITDKNGKIISEKALKKAEGEEFIKLLEG